MVKVEFVGGSGFELAETEQFEEDLLQPEGLFAVDYYIFKDLK